MDAVLGDDYGVEITQSLLELMHLEWFEEGIGDSNVQIVKEETDGKVIREIMVDSLPSDKQEENNS